MMIHSLFEESLTAICPYSMAEVRIMFVLVSYDVCTEDKEGPRRQTHL